MSTMVELPVSRAGTVKRVPSVCVRHGARPTREVPVRFYSAPRPWMLPLFLLGVIPFTVVYLALRKTVSANAWPVCDECLAGLRRVPGRLQPGPRGWPHHPHRGRGGPPRRDRAGHHGF